MRLLSRLACTVALLVAYAAALLVLLPIALRIAV